MAKTWFITGASTGLGRVLAETLLENGENVVATARKTETLESLKAVAGSHLLVLQLDVTLHTEIATAVAAAVQHFGRIDVLVNNAGYGLVGAVEEPVFSEIRPVFETNFFGALAVTQAVLPVMRNQKSGHILNVSSIAGFRGGAGFGLYNATKFALEGMSEALARETAHLGIKVTIVEPGPFRTDFAGRSIVMAQNIIEDYVPSAGQARTYIENADGKQAGDPRRAAEAMIKVTQAENAPLRLFLGKGAFNGAKEKLAQVQKDLDDWAEVSLNTEFK